VSLFVPLVAGLYSKRPGSTEAIAAILAGVAAVVAAKTAGVPGSGLTSPYVLGLAASSLAFGAAFLVLRRSRTRSDPPPGDPPPTGPV